MFFCCSHASHRGSKFTAMCVIPPPPAPAACPPPLSLLASLEPACLHHTRPMSLVPTAVQHSMGPMLTNWMGNVHLKQAVAVSPRSIEELQQCVASASAPLRVMGSGHSFTPLCVCGEVGTLVDMHNLRCVWDLRVGDGCSSISCEGGTSSSLL